MFLEIFCLGCLASVLFSFGKATSESLGSKLNDAARQPSDSYDDEICIDDQLRTRRSSTGECIVLKAWKSRLCGDYHAVVERLCVTAAFVDADTLEELNDKIERKFEELMRDE